MLHSKTRWHVQSQDQQKVDLLSSNLHITPLVAELLINRGIDTVDSAKSFLFLEQIDFHDPFLLKDMDKAVERIKKAIANNENILIENTINFDRFKEITDKLIIKNKSIVILKK